MAKPIKVKKHTRIVNGKRVSIPAHKRKMKPKGKRGLAAVKRLGRNYKTGEFDRIANKAGKKYGAAAGKRIAGAVYWNKVRKRH